MDNILKERLVNRSDKEQFQFTLTCAVCKKVWHSTLLTHADRTYEQALQTAYQEATEQFSICRLCGDPACRDCQITMGEMIVCGTCAKKMKL